MDEDRKYRQHGYQDSGSGRGNGHAAPSPHERFAPPRHPMDITAPRLPRMVRNVTASRCYQCANALPDGYDFSQPCPKCGVELHCCRQCAHFDSSAHFQCAKPIPERITAKDKPNECTFFSSHVTVARDSSVPVPPPRAVPVAAPAERQVPKSVHNARQAFENLFKK